MERTYTVNMLQSLITESSNEFKAKLGPNVESDDKKNNNEAYKEAEKRAKNYDGGLADELGEKKTKYEKIDTNKTTLDYEPDNATPEYKKRVHAQAKGYTSEKEMNNGIEKGGDFSDNENIYQGFKKSGEEMQEKEKEFRMSGLQARELPEKYFDRENMYESKDGFDMRNMINRLKDAENMQVKPIDEAHIKTIYYKKTEFLDENHMISKIPDDFKINGTTFKMKDKNLNEYLVEWKNNKAYIKEHVDKKNLNESIERMKSLMNYKTSDSNTTSTFRSKENDDVFASTLNKIRDIK